MKILLSITALIFAFSSQAAERTNYFYEIKSTKKSQKKNSQGCWAKFYSEENRKGDTLKVSGETQLSNLNIDGKNWEGKLMSLEVGPNAKLTLFGNYNFKDKDHVIHPGTNVNNVKKVPYNDDIESLTVTCV